MEEQKENAWHRTSPGTGEQYLAALIKCADWVPKSYKQLAVEEENKKNAELLKELYLCACDGVPVEKAMEAVKKQPPEGALRFLRQKHLENTVFGDYKAELSGIKKTATTLEQEVRSMSETLMHIANHVPNFDAMFPELPAQEESKERAMQKGEDILNEPVHIKQEKQVKEPELKMKDMKFVASEAETEKKSIVSLFEHGKQKLKGWYKDGMIKQQSIPDFIEKRIGEGYTAEQLDYFLDCIEEGMALSDIEKIASPNLPVDIMQRLWILQERKEKEKNGQ